MGQHSSSRRIGTVRKKYAFLCWLLFACMAGPAVGQAAQTQMRGAAACATDTVAWSCYGALDAAMHFLTDSRQRIPFLRYRVQRFSNQELRAEEESFEEKEAKQGRTIKRYFMVMPSRVELFQGWSDWESPSKSLANELDQVIDTLQAAFPNGPHSIGQKRQQATGTVKRYAYPVGEVSEKKLVTAWTSKDGAIHFQYDDVGEPVGPYEVVGTWQQTISSPWKNDYPLPDTQSNVGQQFRNLGEARRFAPRAE